MEGEDNGYREDTGTILVENMLAWLVCVEDNRGQFRQVQAQSKAKH